MQLKINSIKNFSYILDHHKYNTLAGKINHITIQKRKNKEVYLVVKSTLTSY